MKCHYCKAIDHLINQCPKLKAKEACKKKANENFVDASKNDDSTNVMQAIERAFSVQCSYDPSICDHACMVEFVDHLWYFDSGATEEYITSHRDLFPYLEAVPNKNTVTCANNVSYPIEEDGSIVLC